MGYGRYVGRVGALAVGLGIGLALPAVALADTDSNDAGGTTASAGGAGTDSESGTGDGKGSESASSSESGAGTPSAASDDGDGDGDDDTEPDATAADPTTGDEQEKPAKKSRSANSQAKKDEPKDAAPQPDTTDAAPRATVKKPSPVSETTKPTAGGQRDAIDTTPATSAPAAVTAVDVKPAAAQTPVAAAPSTAVTATGGSLPLEPSAPAGATPVTTLLGAAPRRAASAETENVPAVASTVTASAFMVSQAAAPSNPPSAQFTKTDDWTIGFIGKVDVSAGGSALNGWTVEFDTPAQIVNIWNAEIASRSGNRYVVRNAPWNAQVAAGQSVAFGFEATPGGAQAVLTNLVVNGVPSGQPTPPSASIADASVTEGNTGTRDLAFTVTLSKAATGPVTVGYATANGTATAGQDYTAKSGTVTFAAGETSKTITVAVAGDATVEPNETLTVTLSNPSGVTIATGSATGTITNDDTAPQPTPPSVSIANASVAEGNTGTRDLAFTVTLSKAAAGPVTVGYATANGTATAGQDYTAKSGTVTFAAGETSKTITVAVAGDATVEPNETLTVTLSSPSGATIATGSAIGTITNDDTAVTPPPTGVWGDRFFAPYVDMGAYPVPDLLEISRATGATLLTLGFIQADPNGNPAWAALSALAPTSQHEQALAINKSIADLKAAGGDVMISFGGAANLPLWQSAQARGQSAQQLANTYASIVDFYGVTHLDFDIEGAAVADQASLTLNSQALTLLQQARPDVKIWYTLPVLPSGLTADGVNVMDTALRNGVKPAGVNVMAMNYGLSQTGPNAKTLGAYHVEAGESTYSQMTSLYARYGQTFTYGQLGITPMVGYNDIVTEVSTLADFQTVEDWARARGIGMLSMWSVNRDKPGSFGTNAPYESGLTDPAGAFTRLFSDYGTQNVLNYGATGGGTGGGGSTGGGGTPFGGGATTVVDWKWNTNTVLTFDPAKDKLDFVWMRAEQFTVTEQGGSIRISIVDNNQTYTLQGVSLSQLQAANIVAKDAGTTAKWQALINAAKSV